MDSRSDPVESLRSGTPKLALQNFLQRCANGAKVEVPKEAVGRAGEEFVDVCEEGSKKTKWRFIGTQEEVWKHVDESVVQEPTEARTRNAGLMELVRAPRARY